MVLTLNFGNGEAKNDNNPKEELTSTVFLCIPHNHSCQSVLTVRSKRAYICTVQTTVQYSKVLSICTLEKQISPSRGPAVSQSLFHEYRYMREREALSLHTRSVGGRESVCAGCWTRCCTSSAGAGGARCDLSVVCAAPVPLSVVCAGATIALEHIMNITGEYES